MVMLWCKVKVYSMDGNQMSKDCREITDYFSHDASVAKLLSSSFFLSYKINLDDLGF